VAVDDIGGIQLSVFATRSCRFFPFCGSRPVWALGGLRISECGVGQLPRFVAYTAKLLWFLPPATVPVLALGATVAETLFGLLLVLGWQTRLTSLLSGVLLTTFALSMTLALGVKAPLDYSVFSATGGALLLATYTKFPFSLDGLFRRNDLCSSLTQTRGN
jgi:uncharacterized membrane protein YphA (DoxX/SURF4 family)